MIARDTGKGSLLALSAEAALTNIAVHNYVVT
jgi:hypothetical protein